MPAKTLSEVAQHLGLATREKSLKLVNLITNPRIAMKIQQYKYHQISGDSSSSDSELAEVASVRSEYSKTHPRSRISGVWRFLDSVGYRVSRVALAFGDMVLGALPKLKTTEEAEVLLEDIERSIDESGESISLYEDVALSDCEDNGSYKDTSKADYMVRVEKHIVDVRSEVERMENQQVALLVARTMGFQTMYYRGFPDNKAVSFIALKLGSLEKNYGPTEDSDLGDVCRINLVKPDEQPASESVSVATAARSPWGDERPEVPSLSDSEDGEIWLGKMFVGKVPIYYYGLKPVMVDTFVRVLPRHLFAHDVIVVSVYDHVKQLWYKRYSKQGWLYDYYLIGDDAPKVHTPYVPRGVPGFYAKTNCEVLSDLYYYLKTHAAMKPRDSTLIVALREKARVWCRENEISNDIAGHYLSVTVAVAFVLTKQELRALEVVTSSESRMAAHYTEDGRDGVFRSNTSLFTDLSFFLSSLFVSGRSEIALR